MLHRASSSASLPSASGPAAADIQPLGISEFAELMAAFCPVPPGAPIAVAVSGGGDSMALVLLAAGWAAGRPLRAVTVDHGLRADSRAEAETVHGWLAARGIAHEILSWEGPKPSTGLQEAARAARYRLIGEWARARGVRHVLLAHQLEDQAETVLMRLARGSGIAGLAAMREVVTRQGVHYLRPLLRVPRARLRATLAAAGQDWIEDPSNDSSRFARTAYRRLVARLALHGLDAARLGALSETCARLDAALDAAVRAVIGAAAWSLAEGGTALDASVWRALPEQIAVPVLRRLLAEVGGRPLPPRSDRLARAYARLLMDEVRPFTLAGCRLSVENAVVRLVREAPRRRNDGFRKPPSGL